MNKKISSKKIEDLVANMARNPVDIDNGHGGTIKVFGPGTPLENAREARSNLNLPQTMTTKEVLRGSKELVPNFKACVKMTNKMLKKMNEGDVWNWSDAGRSFMKHEGRWLELASDETAKILETSNHSTEEQTIKWLFEQN